MTSAKDSILYHSSQSTGSHIYFSLLFQDLPWALVCVQGWWLKQMANFSLGTQGFCSALWAVTLSPLTASHYKKNLLWPRLTAVQADWHKNKYKEGNLTAWQFSKNNSNSFYPRVYDFLQPRAFGQDYNTRHEISSRGEGLKFSQKVIICPTNVCHNWTSRNILLVRSVFWYTGMSTGVYSLPPACITPSCTMKASYQGRHFLVGLARLVSLCPEAKVYNVFSNRVLLCGYAE